MPQNVLEVCMDSALKDMLPVIKARAALVFKKIDSGTDPTVIRQPKLRMATEKKLVYNWRPHDDPAKRVHTPADFRAILEVRRDKLNRLYVKRLGALPQEAVTAWNNLQAHPEKMVQVTDQV